MFSLGPSVGFRKFTGTRSNSPPFKDADSAFTLEGASFQK